MGTTAARMPLASLGGVFFRYARHAPWVLRGIDLEVSAGERVGIVGANGTGKSTLAKLLLGLHRPSSGSVRLLGEEVAWRDHFPWLGYIGDPSYAEGALALPGDLVVGRLLEVHAGLFARAGRGLPWGEHLEGALALDDPALRGARVGSLSKGQRQRLLAYLALAKGPRLLVADEATEGLDTASRGLILEQVLAFAAQGTMAVIWISHRQDEIASLATRVFEVVEGRLEHRRDSLFDATVEADGAARHYRRAAPAALLAELAQCLAGPAGSVRLEARRCTDEGVAEV